MGSSHVPPVGRSLSDLQSYRGWEKLNLSNLSLPQPHSSQFGVYQEENTCRERVPPQWVIPGGLGAIPDPGKLNLMGLDHPKPWLGWVPPPKTMLFLSSSSLFIPAATQPPG